jgi:hypothetical protein
MGTKREEGRMGAGRGGKRRREEQRDGEGKIKFLTVFPLIVLSPLLLEDDDLRCLGVLSDGGFHTNKILAATKPQSIIK